MAADRDDRPSLVKMLLTWRATVFSLRNRSAAIARLVLPDATRRSTCASRAVSPPAAGPAAGADSASAAASVVHGAQLLKRPARRVQLHRRAVVVTEAPAGQTDQHPDAGGLVRRFEVVPGLPRPAQRLRGGAPVALVEKHRAGRVHGKRPQQRRTHVLGDPGQLVDGQPGRRDIAGGQHDLDVCGKQS